MKILRKLVCYCLCVIVFWWCVAFRDICAGAYKVDRTDAAVGSGFGADVSGETGQEKNYEIRFYFLDLLGRLQNFFLRK